MTRKLAALAFVALVLGPDPARALIGDTPTIRRVSICPSDPGNRIAGIAMLGQNADGSFVLIVRTFHRDTGMQTGSTLSVPIPQGTVPVELVFSAAFATGHILVLDTALRVHSFEVAFDADGTPKLIGETPTIHGPFGNPAVVGAGTALAEAPGIDGPPALAIGTAGGRLIVVQHAQPAQTIVLTLSDMHLEDVSAIPQVGHFAFLAVTDGRLVGVNPDADPAKPGPQAVVTFTCIPNHGWRLQDIAAPPLDAEDVLTAPRPVRLAAANGAAEVAVLEVPASPTFNSVLRVRVIDPMTDGISQVAVGHIEQTDEGIALLSAAGTGVSFDPGFTLGGGSSAVDLTIGGATMRHGFGVEREFVDVVVEVENDLAAQIDGATLALTAGASSVAPSPGATPSFGDIDGDGNLDYCVQFDRQEVLRMLHEEHTMDVLATWRFTDDSAGRASARVRIVPGPH